MEPNGSLRRSGDMASLERHYNLSAPEMTQSFVQDTHRRSKSNSDCKNYQAYPALARVPSELLGVCVVGTSERVLICETIGPEEARAKLGANATGLPFSSLAKIATNSLLPKEIQAQVDLGNVTCGRNDQLCGARGASEASRLPIASDGVFLRCAA